ncbi:transposase [Richelia sinica FACHB-800]|uniref:Transposase n=1 Tax=Richelia sinica FACHB-800 TaxID=1357546 RepID=A0A975TD09_9NOST|nr:transposase [Richelia sinica FACHB-800]
MLTFCPPAPPERAVVISISFGSMCTSTSSTSGIIATVAVEVYTLAQRQIRTALRKSKSTINNQLGKPTDRPTLRWIFQWFQSIHLVKINNEKHISNWNQQRDFILNLLPDDCLAYYRLAT